MSCEISLGEKTSVKTVLGDTGVLKGLVLRRSKPKRLGGQYAFRLYLDETVCNALTYVLGDIDDTILEAQSSDLGKRRIDLCHSWVVEVSLFYGQVYCGVHKTEGQNRLKRGAGMNFTIMEWNALKEFLIRFFPGQSDPKHETLVDEERPSTTEEPLSSGPPPRKIARKDDPSHHRAQQQQQRDESIHITQYCWKWVAEGKDTIPFESPVWFINDHDCLQDALRNQPDQWDGPGNTKLEMKIDTKQVRVSIDLHFFEELYITLLKKTILKMSEESCEGCEKSLAPQLDHRNGCLMEWEEAVDTYLTRARCLIMRPNLLMHYHKIMNYVGLSQQTSGVVLQMLGNFNPPRDIELKSGIPFAYKNSQNSPLEDLMLSQLL